MALFFRRELCATFDSDFQRSVVSKRVPRNIKLLVHRERPVSHSEYCGNRQRGPSNVEHRNLKALEQRKRTQAVLRDGLPVEPRDVTYLASGIVSHL